MPLPHVPVQLDENVQCDHDSNNDDAKATKRTKGPGRQSTSKKSKDAETSEGNF